MKLSVCFALSLTWVVGCRDTEVLGPIPNPQSTAGKSAPTADNDAGTPDSGKPDAGPAQVSKPGQYKGYSDAVYANGFALSSQYVEVRDGTKLAVDLYRPKKEDGSVVDTPLPVVWMHTPYNRRYFSSATTGRGLAGETYPGAAARLIEYGYVVAIADFRGVYASYGTNVAYNRGEWIDAAHWDAYDITEWLAVQPWSTGKVGMWGCSATGGSQLQAASTAPPHLKAIFPMSCEFDVYPFGVFGGVSAPKGTPTSAPPMPTSAADRDPMAEPVDGDADKSQLTAAIAQHATGIENVGYAPFRDSTAENVPEQWWIKSSPHTYLEQIKASGVAIYLAANWDEATTKYGAFFTFNNVMNPVKLLVGPGTHCAWFSVQNETGFDIATEELRFFDYWLKGIENGVMSEPPVYYYTYNASADKMWKSSDKWPLMRERRTSYYLGGSKTLGIVPPSGVDTRDEIKVDYDTTPDNILEKGLVYESPDLSVDIQITGHPTVDLWVSSTATDGDFVATLQDVAPDGTAKSYNTYGRLRASLRKEDTAPYNNLNLPWHRGNAEDAVPLVANEPTQIKFDLLPLSMIFRKNHRIRLVLTFSAGKATPPVDPVPMITLYRDAMHRSVISLPVIPPAAP
jgi:predicted acyl esterase